MCRSRITGASRTVTIILSSRRLALDGSRLSTGAPGSCFARSQTAVLDRQGVCRRCCILACADALARFRSVGLSLGVVSRLHGPVGRLRLGCRGRPGLWGAVAWPGSSLYERSGGLCWTTGCGNGYARSLHPRWGWCTALTGRRWTGCRLLWLLRCCLSSCRRGTSRCRRWCGRLLGSLPVRRHRLLTTRLRGLLTGLMQEQVTDAVSCSGR